ncbi:MAG: hypothetical protein IKA19_03385 [Muribaculaceae bacterium]|nr:hypothetical protein [Muribaculaceae bacterium]
MKEYYKFRKRLETLPVECPVCGRQTDSLKSYTLPDITFLFIATQYGSEQHIACAECMRKAILQNAAISIVKTNLLWPIFVFPRLSVNLTRTFVKGHSEVIIDELQFKIQQEWK